jgi:hypothetical protein
MNPVHLTIRKTFHNWILLCIVLATYSLTNTLAQENDPEARVTKVIAETEDKIFFQATVSKTIFKRGDNIPINYQVQNKGKKTIYLVTEPTSNVLVEDLSILRIVQPVVGADDHLPYNYDLIKLPPKKNYKGSLLIKASVYLENKKYDFSITEIQVGFSYLFDKSNLDGCKQATWTRPCLYELYKKSKSLTLGNLLVEIKK